MKLPRDLSGDELARQLGSQGYQITRQTGSHMRLTRQAQDEEDEHHVTVPQHRELKVGTLSSILGDVASHLGVTKTELVRRLFES